MLKTSHERAKTALHQLVAACEHGIVIPELMSAVQDIIPVTGTRTIEGRRLPNLYLWSNVSQEFADAFNELVNEEKIHLCPAREDAYYRRGLNPGLPVSRCIPEGGYTEPHWFPVLVKSEPWTG